MNIVLVGDVRIPAKKYGGIERILWWLGNEFQKKDHQVTYIAEAGSNCPFAKVVVRDKRIPIEKQIPAEADIVHFHYPIKTPLSKPYVVTIHGNHNDETQLDRNAIFVSKNHAARYGAQAYVYNGIDISAYKKPVFAQKRNFFHFLGKAAWRVKNVQGAIDIATDAGEKLRVLGGTRFNVKMGVRFTHNTNVRFYGMVDDLLKAQLLNRSKGLLFPVQWHEPFGIALIESLYMGSPVFGTPYGALPELIIPEVGYLSDRRSELVQAVSHAPHFNEKFCHEYVCDSFLASHMAAHYLQKYQRVLDGYTLNPAIPKRIQQTELRFLPWKQ